MKPVTNYTELESSVRQALNESDLSLREIEKVTEISKTHLANFKNKQRNISFPNLTKLADYFKIRYNLKNY
jgi:transcriptional regulator with XRE-family HTH domain